MTLGAVDIASYLPVLLLMTMAILFAIGNLAGSQLIGPRRTGAVKEGTYESGMNPVGNARKRFNIRFYLIAMVFLVFDIEIIFLYPWAVTFPNLDHQYADGAVWLGRILFFMLTTIVAYIYGYRKGVFKFD
jgi:NADH-quinone oxidoreductase subunit A